MNMFIKSKSLPGVGSLMAKYGTSSFVASNLLSLLSLVLNTRLLVAPGVPFFESVTYLIPGIAW